MIAGIPAETFPGEHRVSITPGVIPALTKAGVEVLLEAGAGQSAGFTDTAYLDTGARIATNRTDLFRQADIILQVRTPGANPSSGQPELDLLRSHHTVIGLADPLSEPTSARALASRGVTCLSMDLIPRITRAQSMDALSSMATIAGYKAVIVAAERLPRMFPMMMTAAGTVKPARVFIVGAGVAGLQAIASARRMGARVEAYDVRPAVKEQVESLGATFVDLPLDTDGSEDKGGYATAQNQTFYDRQQAMMSRIVESSDVIITTAMIPGRPAPLLITDEMIAGMAAGAVVVDLAAERGGNVAPSLPDQVVIAHDVTILGPTNLPASVPNHASQMYAKNVSTFLIHLLDNGKVRLNLDDEITQSTLVCHDGQVVHPRVRELLAPQD